MKRHISFPSIEAYRNVVKEVTLNSTYVGKNEEGYPLYDESIRKPTLIFTGTVKLHGTNAAVCYNNVDGFWAQSREHIITPEKDNAGFARFAIEREHNLKGLIQTIALEQGINLDENTISIYGEWAGKGIQDTVAISKINRGFFIFGIKVSPRAVSVEEETGLVSEQPTWLAFDGYSSTSDSVYNILDYPVYLIEIDFNNPSKYTDRLNEWTKEVEDECPVSLAHGVTGLGEGIVFTAFHNGKRYAFKSKGEKHSVVNTKTPNAVDPEKLKSIESFVEYAVTEPRLHQAIVEVFKEETPDIKKLGEIIKWVSIDINKEESDTLEASSLTMKEASGAIARKVKEMFLAHLDSLV